MIRRVRRVVSGILALAVPAVVGVIELARGGHSRNNEQTRVIMPAPHCVCVCARAVFAAVNLQSMSRTSKRLVLARGHGRRRCVGGPRAVQGGG